MKREWCLLMLMVTLSANKCDVPTVPTIPSNRKKPGPEKWHFLSKGSSLCMERKSPAGVMEKRGTKICSQGLPAAAPSSVATRSGAPMGNGELQSGVFFSWLLQEKIKYTAHGGMQWKQV